MNSGINDDGLRDPYTKAVDHFLELFEKSMPPGKLTRDISDDIKLHADENKLFYKDRASLNELLHEAMIVTHSISFPHRDRILLAHAYENCEYYSKNISHRALKAQALLEKAYADSQNDERGFLSSLACSRDSLFETPDSEQVSSSFNDDILGLLKQRRSLNRSIGRLLDELQAFERSNHPSYAR